MKIDKIKVLIFSRKGWGEKLIEDSSKIKEIVALLEKRSEECEIFVDSPQLMSFRIELYQDKKLLSVVAVVGNAGIPVSFMQIKEQWFFLNDSSLVNKLIEYTKDVPLTKIEATFV
jgi:hypothetical protein